MLIACMRQNLDFMNGKLVKAILLLLAVYFPIAIYLHLTFVPSAPISQYWLPYPPHYHINFTSVGHAYISWLPPAFDEVADDEENPTRSPLQLFEDGKPLGPAHSSVDDIVQFGGGRYLHWKGVGLIFSPSDNGDPNAPWRKYSVRPDLSRKTGQP